MPLRVCDYATELDISNNKFKKIPKDINSLYTMQKIDAKYNQLGAIPGTLFRLKELRQVDLSSNLIKKIPPTLPKATGLLDFDLRENKIRALPAAINKAKSILRFDVSNNIIKTFRKQAYELTGSLDISRNRLNGLPPIGAKQKATLKKLDASYNTISKLPQTIDRVSFLRRLDLSNNNITHVPESFGNLRYLNYLDMSNNDIEEIPNSICQLKYNLVELYLSNNKISKFPKDIDEYKKLRVLDLSANQLVKIPRKFAMNQSIKHVNLSKNQLEDISPVTDSLLIHFLDISENCIPEIPETIKNLVYLETLLASHNQIRSVSDDPRNSFFTLLNKRELFVSLTVLELVSLNMDELPKAIPNLRLLEELYFDDNNVTQFPEVDS
ncbi:leucine-rich repeat and death domain-containing protein 1-like [Octopus sinensis]|uniref:Leucine-rich repeat and death domain-containing protein 1-like n=1 Tax=Octopus sinensis TaxID=2607531 RepID=A0A6P7TQU0_9MOLL|nr:leucine-rich repeat and death domain-containing protein 1-like [Octopus sinensis]